MPHSEATLHMSSSADVVWAAIKNVEAYPRFMENVRHVTISAGATAQQRVSSWSVDLDGSILEWTEADEIDEGSRTMTFAQITGDLEQFNGQWSVVAEPDGTSTAKLAVQFEIGIPLLAEMLNPVAAQALRENALAMLQDIDTHG